MSESRLRSVPKRAVMAALIAFVVSVTARAAPSREAELRVLDYIGAHLQPGQPLMITELYNHVFTQPDERRALNKLYNAFFRIPLFMANYQERYKRPPTLATIAEQFDLPSPAAAGILLRVMESDPRIPPFLSRDPKTGEITYVDVEMIKADPNFGQILTHQIGEWEGRPAPNITWERLGGGQLSLSSLGGKVVLLEVWFTGCPPCMQEAPVLASLNRELSSHGLDIIGANADRMLGLDYDDVVRQHYAQQHHIDYLLVNWKTEDDRAFGGISIYPTLFLIDRSGIIRGHWIGYTPPETLRKAILQPLSGD